MGQRVWKLAIAGAWFAAALALARPATADPLSVLCPSGTVGIANHLGVACQLPQCQHDGDCKAQGEVCRDQPWCIRNSITRDKFAGTMVITEHFTGPCDANDRCPSSATCVVGPRCVASGPPAAPPTTSGGGCAGRSGSAAMFAPFALLGRRRRRR